MNQVEPVNPLARMTCADLQPVQAPYFALRQLGIQNFEQTFVVDVAPHVSRQGMVLVHTSLSVIGETGGECLSGHVVGRSRL